MLYREGYADILNYLLDTDPSCWDTKSKNGRTPLHTVGMSVCVQCLSLTRQLKYYHVTCCLGNTTVERDMSKTLMCCLGNKMFICMLQLFMEEKKQ